MIRFLKSSTFRADKREHIEQDIVAAEKEMDDDSESIITNERYIYIASIIKDCLKKKNKGELTVSDKIDKIGYKQNPRSSYFRSCNVPGLLHRNGNSRSFRNRLG